MSYPVQSNSVRALDHGRQITCNTLLAIEFDYVSTVLLHSPHRKELEMEISAFAAHTN